MQIRTEASQKAKAINKPLDFERTKHGWNSRKSTVGVIWPWSAFATCAHQTWSERKGRKYIIF